ncbi:MAG: ShlB/FhaC/HecB family hemolysin secretion/activation protein [bacterium]
MKKINIILITILMLLALALNASAAVSLPSSDKEIREAESGRKMPEPKTAPLLPETGKETKGSENISFQVDSFAFISGEKLAEAKLQKIAEEYTHKEITLNELNQLLSKLTAYCRTHGYPAASAVLLPQDFARNGGEVVIQIMTGVFGEIRIENDSEVKDERIRELLKPLTKGKTITAKTLETALYNINSLAGVKAVGILSPGREVGSSDLTVKAERKSKPDNYLLYMDNYGGEATGRYRYQMAGSVANLAHSGDYLSASVLLSNEEQHDYSLDYEMSFGSKNHKLGVGISRMDYTLGIMPELGLEGEALTLSLWGSTPFYRTSKDSLTLHYGYDYRKLKDSYNLFDLDLDKHSHAFHLGLLGSRNNPDNRLDYAFIAYHGKMVMDSDFARLLYRSVDDTYTKAVYSLGYLQRLGRDVSLNVRLRGQLAADNLDSSEQFYLGGADGVRAYSRGAGAGDEGILATVQLNVATSVPGLTASVFYDTGHVKTVHDGSGEGITMKGYGLGLQYLQEYYFCRLEYARKIGSSLYDKNDDSKLWFTAGTRF